MRNRSKFSALDSSVLTCLGQRVVMYSTGSSAQRMWIRIGNPAVKRRPIPDLPTEGRSVCFRKSSFSRLKATTVCQSSFQAIAVTYSSAESCIETSTVGTFCATPNRSNALPWTCARCSCSPWSARVCKRFCILQVRAHN